MAFSVPLIDNSILYLSRDGCIIPQALGDGMINLRALGFPEGEHPSYDQLLERIQDLIKELH